MSNITELVFILDKSGSMQGLEKDTIGGFNSFIEKQKKEEGTTLLTTILFSNSHEILHDRLDIKEVKPLTEKDYWTSGCTALLDTVGYAITHIMKIHKYIREEDKPEHTIFVITTDGMENASREYSYSQIKELINKRQEEDKWQFIFLADNMDAAEHAERMGIDRRYAANYNTREDTRAMYDVVSKRVMCCKMNIMPERNLQEMMDDASRNKDNPDKK